MKLTTNGDLRIIRLCDGTNVHEPNSLIQDSDGDFYGTTLRPETNGPFGPGTIFKLTDDGTLTTLFSFNGTNGASPASGPLLELTNGIFYGMTQYGGLSNYGTIFRLSMKPSPPVIQTVTRAGGTLI